MFNFTINPWGFESFKEKQIRKGNFSQNIKKKLQFVSKNFIFFCKIENNFHKITILVNRRNLNFHRLWSTLHFTEFIYSLYLGHFFFKFVIYFGCDIFNCPQEHIPFNKELNERIYVHLVIFFQNIFFNCIIFSNIFKTWLTRSMNNRYRQGMVFSLSRSLF